MKVEIYSTPSCKYCDMAKEFFKDNGVFYTEYNVKDDPELRKSMIERSGQMGVPVIVINDEITVGYNVVKLKEMLNL